MPAAVNCWVAPRGMVAVAGVTEIETITAGVTVITVLPLTEAEVAVMVVAPCPVPLARPCVPTALLIVAMLVDDELQTTDVLRSCVLPSLYVPVAVNCCVIPKAIDGVVGLTVIETSMGAWTVKIAVLLSTEPNVAVIFVEP